jgi:hypothetical protein
VGAIDNITIKAIAGYQWARSYRASDYDASSLDGISSVELDKQTYQMSGELQILGKAFDGKRNFMFGAYADRERTPGDGSRLGHIYPFLEPARVLSSLSIIKLRNKSRALYSQMTYRYNAGHSANAVSAPQRPRSSCVPCGVYEKGALCYS